VVYTYVWFFEHNDTPNDLLRSNVALTVVWCCIFHYIMLIPSLSFHSADNVEMEIVLPGDMTVRESHDIALELQHKIEGLEEVERAFVHVSDVNCKMFLM